MGRHFKLEEWHSDPCHTLDLESHTSVIHCKEHLKLKLNELPVAYCNVFFTCSTKKVGITTLVGNGHTNVQCMCKFTYLDEVPFETHKIFQQRGNLWMNCCRLFIHHFSRLLGDHLASAGL